MRDGRWSPDGRYVAAKSDDGRRLVLFDVQSQRWVELTQAAQIQGVYWSRDGKTVYFQDAFGGKEQPIFRVRISDHKLERVTQLREPLPLGVTAFSLAGLAPDNSPLATLIRSSSDIYALELDIP